MDPNLPRWIMASCRTHFAAKRSSYDLFYEHTGLKPRIKPDGTKIITYAELRVDGPFTQKVSVNEEIHDIEINILLTTPTESRDADAIERMIGVFAVAFTDVIGIFKYGDGIGDDRSSFGCLTRLDTHNEQIRINRFGQVSPETLITQASIEAHYRTRLAP